MPWTHVALGAVHIEPRSVVVRLHRVDGAVQAIEGGAIIVTDLLGRLLKCTMRRADEGLGPLDLIGCRYQPLFDTGAPLDQIIQHTRDTTRHNERGRVQVRRITQAKHNSSDPCVILSALGVPLG